MNRVAVLSSHLDGPPQFVNGKVVCSTGIAICWRKAVPRRAKRNASPVFIIRGLGMTKEDSDGLSSRLAGATGREVVTVDNRGSGGSDSPVEDFTFADMARDCADVMEALYPRGTRFHVIGVSMGGCIAMRFALQHPTLLASLTIGCSYAGKGEDIGVPDRYRELAMLDVPAEPGPRAKHLEELFRYSFTDSWITARRSEFDRLLRDYIQSETLRMQKPGGRGQEKAVMDFLSTGMLDEVKGISAPTLVITGDSDNLVPFHNSLTLRSLIPKSSLAVLPASGHLFWEMHPALTISLFAEFFELHD